MRALVWLAFPYHNTSALALAFGHQIRTNIFSAELFSGNYRAGLSFFRACT